MAQKKKPALTPKTTKKKQPLSSEIELQLRQEELERINRELAHSQAELESAYRQYADLYDFAPVGYFTLTRNGTIHQVNLAGANLLGMNHHEVTQLRLAAFVSSESSPAFKKFFEKLLSGEGKEACELVFKKKGDDLLWARLEATCFEGGNVCRAMLTDITERKRMEQILQESENRFRTLLQDVSTIAVQGYAIDGTTQYWNTASERLYGYSAQEALGQSLLDLIIPLEMRSEVWQAIQRMGETGEPIPAAELSLMRKDGSRVDVFSSHAIVSVPGRTPELFCLDIDLTERRQAEKALQESESRYRELIELAVDGILIGSPEGIIIGANSHMLHLAGRTLNNLVGKHVNELFNPDELKNSPLRFDLLQNGETVTNERQLVHPDGNVVPIEMHTKMMPDGTYQSIYRDITERKQAEKLLKESEWRTRIVSELTTDYIFVVDVDPNGTLKFRWASDNLFRMTGRTVEDAATSDKWGSIIHPDDRDRFFDFTSRILSTAEEGMFECRSLDKGGRERWIWIFARPQVSEDNRVTTIVGAIQDISERKQAVKQLQESEKRFRNLVETTSDWIWEINADGVYTYASPRIRDILGYESSEIIGKRPEDFMPPEEAQRVLSIITPIFTARNPFSNFENKNLHKDGRIIILETSGVPIVDNDGIFCGYRGIDRDITERKQAQEALKKSEAHYHELVETSQDLIWQCDSEGRYTYLNPAWEQVFGYKTKEMLGKKFADFQTPQMAARDQKEFARLMRGSTIKGFETSHIGRLGNEIHLVFNAKSISDENGKVVGTHGTAYDITERKKAEQALKESENLYRKMNENSPLGMHFYKLDDDNQLLFVGANPAADKLLGLDNSQFIGKPIEEAFPPLIQTEVPSRYRDAAEKGIPWSTEQIVYADKKITGAFDVRAFQTSPGNMVAIFADVTERKQVEQALRENQELFSLFMLHSPIYAFIKEVIPNQSRVLQASDNYLQMIGISGRDMAGKTMEELFPAEFAAKFTADDWSVVNSGEVLKLDEDLNGRHYTTIKFPITQGDKTLLAGYTIDITERVHAQEALKQSEAQYRLLIENQTDLVVKIDNKGNFLYVSPSYCRVFGKTEAELIGESFIPLVHPDDVEATQHAMEKLHQFPYACQFEQRVMTKDGWRWFGWSDTAELNNNDEVVSIIGVGRDITERKQVEVELQYMKEGLETANRELQTALALQQQLAHTDALTGINNRRHLYELAEHEFEIAARYKQPLSAIMFDIDHFKEVNDTYGHAIGDQILQRVTQVACAKLRSADVIGRYGGEEFVIILPMTNAKQAYPLAERIRMGVSVIRLPTEKGIATVTLSIGIVEIIHGALHESAESLIRRADEAMYAAKQAGRNRTEIGD